jgi:beta-lactamase regulating signal transducer with metallopeptidase domain
MNLSFLSPAQTWQLLGWTMILFLAAGTIVFLTGGALRILLRRANPGIRYATSLMTFGLLALMPIVIAVSFSREAERVGDDRSGQPRALATGLTTKHTNDTKELPNAEHDPEFVTYEYTVNLDGIAAKPLPVSREAERVADERALASTIDIAAIFNHSATYLPWLWCVGTPLTFLLLAMGLVGAERLRSSCQLLEGGPISTACDELRGALGITRQVGIAVCERIATPLLVGVVKPLILLPPAALNGWTTAELEMVLVHELAHVRRWDNAVNLAQRIVESLLFFHPAVWIVSGWVRRDREDCCDAAVVRHTAKPQAYAELLLALASHQPLAGLATGMAQHPVAGRIRRILKLEDEPMLVTRKGLTIGVSTVVVAALLAFALPPSDAEESASRNSTVSRESERVADERAEPTNPTRQRGEEETTNDTKDTKEELNAEAAKSAEDVETTEVQIEIPGDAEDLASVKESLHKQGYKSRFERIVTEDGRYVNVVWITLPKHPRHRVVFEEHPDGLRASVIRYDESGKVIEPAVNDPNPFSVESPKAAKSAEKNPLFPTLEEQRAADLAYKLLGVELEKLTPEELERVKAKGYKGGLKVGPNSKLEQGDLLVGLHVWPTQSLEQVSEILSRDDLDQLSPLKFYVIHKVYGGESQFSGDVTGEDLVNSGRILVDLDAWQAMRERANSSMMDPGAGATAQPTLQSTLPPGFEPTAQPQYPRQGNMDPGPPLEQPMMDPGAQSGDDNQPAYSRDLYSPVDPNAKVDLSESRVVVYDGKTFDEWRSLWKSELKTEKRIECIKALAAFGRAGKGQEAAEAILDVAAEYDFHIISGGSAGDLKQAITGVLAGNESLPGQYWLPLLIERVKDGPDKWSYFAYWVLGDVQGKDVILYLKQLAKNNSLSADARGAALAGMASQPDIAEDAEAVAMVRRALTGDKPVMHVFNKLRFYHLDLIPEQYDLLFHKDAQIRATTFGMVRGGGGDIEPIISKLLEMLDDSTRSEDHEKALVALYRLNGHFINIPERRRPVADKITDILIRGDTELLPASLALMSLLGHKGEKNVVNELGAKITDERRKELEAAIPQAQELQKQRGLGGGGAGGMGGGGMF